MAGSVGPCKNNLRSLDADPSRSAAAAPAHPAPAALAHPCASLLAIGQIQARILPLRALPAGRLDAHLCATYSCTDPQSVFDKSGSLRKSGEARPDLREIEANSQFYLTKARADLDRFRRFCSRFTTFQTRSKGAVPRSLPLRSRHSSICTF